jgi:nucleotide-binding universal stress UspA family protein
MRDLAEAVGPEKGPMPTGRSTILLGLLEGGQPTASLLRATRLARAFDADLHVLSVLTGAVQDPLYHQLFSPAEAVEHALVVQESTRAWLGEHCSADVVERFAVVHGDFTETVVGHAEQIGAMLIVVAPTEGHIGHAATTLAHKSGIPVLVAREAGHEGTIVAATDMKTPDYPVLREAAEIGERLGEPVIAVHNFYVPTVAMMGVDASWPMPPLTVPPLPTERYRAVRQGQLVEASKHLPGKALAIVRTEDDPVEAILDEAQLHDADVVVVGTRVRSWFARLGAAGIAAKVVNRTTRSVLVTPIGEPGGGAERHPPKAA